IITGSGRKAARNPAFKWVNSTLGNIKSAITGTYRNIRDRHVPRYLAEFEYRFNRRYDLATMRPRLGYVAVRTPPMPYRLLKLAEDHAQSGNLLRGQVARVGVGADGCHAEDAQPVLDYRGNGFTRIPVAPMRL